ncbi:dihydroorotate oxidase B electron transfer subunit [Roseivirga pacifica]|uniref:Dihydroorotate oxidase B, electron transfer subunit n=2 Tax=Roseivirga pacifica TaxID=1267423 RepID=A0A1I0QWT3_9BACT|nr:dihydroorotate oxidase B electron transfer subunit [Roseivirga pacifica]SEW31987.1 dihydroorotate oxidase B, electron transfer subunit [Roseivirga pacifica]
MIKRQKSTFFSIGIKDIIPFMAVFWALGISRIIILIVPFRVISSWIGTLNKETPIVNSKNKTDSLIRIRKMILRVSFKTPWESNCLTQALCAHWILRLKSIEHTTYIGVKLSKSNTLESHAWLRSGNTIITGHNGFEKYTVVSTHALFIN